MASTKEHITVRLSKEVMDWVRARQDLWVAHSSNPKPSVNFIIEHSLREAFAQRAKLQGPPPSVDAQPFMSVAEAEQQRLMNKAKDAGVSYVECRDIRAVTEAEVDKAINKRIILPVYSASDPMPRKESFEIPICGKTWWEDGEQYECLMDEGHQNIKHGQSGMVRRIEQ